MNIVKCPNPSCPFQFDSSLVPAGATIACPQCRLQFSLPASPTHSAAPPKPADAELLEPDAPDDDTPPRRPLRQRRDDTESTEPKRKRSRNRDDAESEGDDAPPPKKANTAALLALVAVGLVVLCGGGVVGLGFAFGWFGGKKGGSETSEFRHDAYGLTLNGPGEGWSKDDDIRKWLKVNLTTFKRADPEAYVAVSAHRSTGRPALKSELMPKAVKLLREAFDDVEDQLTPVDAIVLGEKGQKYPFSGRYKATGTGCQGEVHAVAVRDMQVWVFVWADRDKFDQLSGQFDRFRGGIKLDPPKPGATVKIPEQQFRTPKGLFQLIDKDDQWKKQDNPTTQEDAADLWLTGTLNGGGKGSEAQLVVAVLEAGADAKAHVIARFDDDNHKAAQSLVEAEPEGDDAPSGKVAAQADVVRVKLTYPGADKSANLFVVYKVVDTGGKRVVAYASCGLKQMGYWEQRMMGTVGSLKGLK